MDADVQRILIIAVAVVVVGLAAILFGRRLSLKWGDKSMETDRGRAAMTMSATRGGAIEGAKQIAEGEAGADMDMKAQSGTIKNAEQRTGGRAAGPS
jgi:hypothetical protein